MKRFVTSILLTFLCCSVQGNEVSTKVLSFSDLEKIGYKETDKLKYDGQRCDQYEIDFPATKRYQSIKSLKPITEGQNIYYRFTLIKEKFKNEENAIKRLEQFKQTNKIKSDSWYSKSCSLKQGFRRGVNVYFVATDAGMFKDQIADVVSKLKRLLILSE